MEPTVLLPFLAWLALLPAGTQAPAQPAQSEPVRCEFRVFDGDRDVTSETRVRVYPTGQKENGVATDSGGRVRLAPGLYDVQMIRTRGGQVSDIRWLEHLLVARYPDEEGQHLEVANFKPQYGALELRWGGHDFEATAFAAGDRARPVATGVRGDGYVLLVVPAARYDVRIKGAGAAAPVTWLTGIDVPAGRTRLRSIGPGTPGA